MPTYIGFSTLGVNQPRELVRTGIDGGVATLTSPPRLGKKFRVVDEKLVMIDLVNSFNIKQGDKVGQPQYGTTIWSLLFEPNTNETRQALEAEIRRVISLDPRVILNNVALYEQDIGVLVEVEIAVSPFNNAVQLGFLLNRATGSANTLS